MLSDRLQSARLKSKLATIHCKPKLLWNIAATISSTMKPTIVNFDFGSNQPMMGEPLKTVVIDGCHSPKSKPQWTLMKAHMFVVLCYVTIRAGDGGQESSVLGRKSDFPLTQPLSPTSSLSNFKDSIWSWMTLLHNLWNEVCKDLLTGCNLTNQSTKSSSSARRSSLAPPPPGESSDDGHWLLIACQSPPSQIMECHLGTQMIWFLWKVSKFGKKIFHFGVFPEWVDGDIEETMFPNLCSGGRTLYGHYSYNNHIIFS